MKPDTSNQGLERALARAVERSTPDVRAEAAAAPVVPLVVPDGIIPYQAPRRPRRIRRAVAALCACLAAVVVGLGLYSYFAPASYIRIEVNPGLEIEANRYDRVLAVHPLNREAEEVLGDMKLTHMDLDTAINAITGALVRQGWLDGGAEVTVWVSGGSRDENLSIQRRVADDIEALLDGRTQVVTPDDEEPEPVPADTPRPSPQATPSPVATPGPGSEATPSPTPTPPQTPAPSAVVIPVPGPDDIRTRAARNGISYGKQVFIDCLRDLDPGLDEEALAAMSLRDLAALVEERGFDLSFFPDYEWDESTAENIEEFIDDVNDDEEDRLEAMRGWD